MQNFQLFLVAYEKLKLDTDCFHFAVDALENCGPTI